MIVIWMMFICCSFLDIIIVNNTWSKIKHIKHIVFKSIYYILLDILLPKSRIGHHSKLSHLELYQEHDLFYQLSIHLTQSNIVAVDF